ANVDADNLIDLVVIADTIIAVHYGKEGGEFDVPVTVLLDATKLFTDLVVTESKTTSILIFKGKGAREFEALPPIKASAAPTAVILADVNGDQRLDITTSSAN